MKKIIIAVAFRQRTDKNKTKGFSPKSIRAKARFLLSFPLAEANGNKARKIFSLFFLTLSLSRFLTFSFAQSPQTIGECSRTIDSLLSVLRSPSSQLPDTAKINTLILFQEKSMEEQREILNETIDKWKGELEQVDDIYVLLACGYEKRAPTLSLMNPLKKPSAGCLLPQYFF